MDVAYAWEDFVKKTVAINYSSTDSSLEGSSVVSSSCSMSPGAFHSCTEPLPIAIKNVAVASSTADETPNTNRHQPANFSHTIERQCDVFNDIFFF